MPFCAVNWCKKKSQTSNYSVDGVTFHRFPTSLKRKEKWVDATGRLEPWKPTRNSSVCSSHFEESCFYQHGSTRRLYETAVPTLNLPALVSNIPDESDDTPDESNKNELVKIVKPVRRRKMKPVPIKAIPRYTTATLLGSLQPVNISPKLNTTTLVGNIQQITPALGTLMGTLRPINPLDLKPILNQGHTSTAFTSPLDPNLQVPTSSNAMRPNRPIAPKIIPTALINQTNVQSVIHSQPVITSVTSLNPQGLASSENRSSTNVYASSSYESALKPVQENQIVDPSIVRERKMKRQIDHLRCDIQEKNRALKCLREQNNYLQKKVINLKKIIESLVKVKSRENSDVMDCQ